MNTKYIVNGQVVVAAPALQQHDPDVHGLQQSLYPPRIPTAFNALTVQQRMVQPSTIPSQCVQHTEYILPPATTLLPATTIPTATATASSSLSAPAVGLSTGVSPINTGVPVVDNTETEFANTGGTTENVEDIACENQQYGDMNASTYEHDYGHIPTDDVGIAVALAMTENRRPGLSLSTLTEAEHMEGTLDTTQLESGTTTAPELMLTPSTSSTTATSLTRDALTHAIDMA